MNGRERIEALLSGGLPDRVPLMPITIRSAARRPGARWRVAGCYTEGSRQGAGRMNGRERIEALLSGGLPDRVPLMPPGIFRLRNLTGANVVIFLLYAAIFGFWFFQSLYMQGTLGYSALETGLAFAPMTLAVGTGATLAPRLARRFGARAVLAAGMLSATIGEALLIGVHPGGTYLANVLPGGLLGAFGLGLALVPATIVAVEGVPRALSGLASGVLNTSRFIGAALGLAVLSTIAAHHTDAEIGSGTSATQALTDGFALQFAVGAVFCLVGVIAAVVLLRPQRAEAVLEGVPGAERA